MDEALKKLLATVNKKYGKGTLLPASEATSLVIDRLPSGILDLDMKIGGGFPRGRISMVKGDYSTGKSAVCMGAAAIAQRTCRFCGTPFEKVTFSGEVLDLECDCGKEEPMLVVWLDAEHSFDPSWSEKWGIDPDRLFVIQTEYAEQGIDVADACIRSKQCDLLVVDSIAAMAPGVEVEESVSGDSMVLIRGNVRRKVRHLDIQSAYELFPMSDEVWETLAYEEKEGFCWRKVKNIWKPSEKEDTRKMFEIKTSYGKSIKVTGDHSIYRLVAGPGYKSPENTVVFDAAFELVNGSDIRPGDYLLASDGFPRDRIGIPVKVRTVESITPEPVYDMEVEGAANFVANGLLVHNSSEKWQVGVMARLMNKALRKWTSGMNSGGLLAETKCTILLINQMRLNLGGYRVSMTSPGGKGLDFFESLEIRFKKDEYVEDPVSQRPIGISVDFEVKKNKTAPPAPPGGKFSLYFVPNPGRYTIGSSDIDVQVLRLASFWGLIKKGGAWFTFPDGSRVQGKKKAALKLQEEPELVMELEAEIRARELSWMETGEAPGRSAKSEEDEDEDEDSE